MLAYTVKQFIYSLTVLVVLIAVLFWLYKQPQIKDKVDAVYADFQKYMEKYAVRPPEPKVMPVQEIEKKEAVQVVDEKETKQAPEIIVKQSSPAQTISLGFDAENRIVAAYIGTNIVTLDYENSSLRKISATKQIEFTYGERGLLTNITTPRWTINLNYDRYDRLNVYAAPDDKIRFDWDINDQLTGFKTDQGVPTTFTYYDNKKIKSFRKQSRETVVRYDDKNRIKSMQTDDDFMLIHYWKDNLMSSLSGSKYGLKETVNYGPTEIKLVSNTDEQVFSSGTDETRAAAFNLYLTCKKIKHLPVVFDPLAWAVYSDYFKKGIVEYLVNNFVCNAIYGTEFD